MASVLLSYKHGRQSTQATFPQGPSSRAPRGHLTGLVHRGIASSLCPSIVLRCVVTSKQKR
eukprot:13751737-Alexandrium_andersonii.AAC.1